MAMSDLSNFGPRAMQYFKAAQKSSGYLHNANGTVNKANLSALKADVGPVQAPAAAKQNARAGRIDVVA